MPDLQLGSGLFQHCIGLAENQCSLGFEQLHGRDLVAMGSGQRGHGITVIGLKRLLTQQRIC